MLAFKELLAWLGLICGIVMTMGGLLTALWSNPNSTPFLSLLVFAAGAVLTIASLFVVMCYDYDHRHGPLSQTDEPD